VFPRTRKIRALMAIGIHLGILLTLSPVGRSWNQSVWPWNIALALAGAMLIAPWKENPILTLKSCRPIIRALVIFLLIAPVWLLFWGHGCVYAHNLYSSNVPSANVDGAAALPDLERISCSLNRLSIDCSSNTFRVRVNRATP